MRREHCSHWGEKSHKQGFLRFFCVTIFVIFYVVWGSVYQGIRVCVKKRVHKSGLVPCAVARSIPEKERTFF